MQGLHPLPQVLSSTTPPHHHNMLSPIETYATIYNIQAGVLAGKL